MKITRRQLKSLINEQLSPGVQALLDKYAAPETSPRPQEPAPQEEEPTANPGGWYEMSVKSSNPDRMRFIFSKKDSSHWAQKIKQKMGSPSGLSVETVKVSLVKEEHPPSPDPHLHVSVEIGPAEDTVSETALEGVSSKILSALDALFPGEFSVTGGPANHIGHSHGSRLSHTETE